MQNKAEALVEKAERPQLGPGKQREDIWFGNRKQKYYRKHFTFCTFHT
jgi:hypothetical protein